MKPQAILCDLDGTLANLNGRLPYGESQATCEEDLLREDVRDMVQEYADRGLTIILMSGRFRRYTEHTVRWLEKHNIPWDELFLREDDDMRGDEVIKRELYEDYIEPFYDIITAIDDRNKIIRLWRSLGISVIDVGNGVEF